MQINITMDSTTAANIIKRAMRFNRDRIHNAIMIRHLASRDILVAYQCIYVYTDDYNGCCATMMNDQIILNHYCDLKDIECANAADKYPQHNILKRENEMYKTFPQEWTSKKKVRHWIQSRSLQDIYLMTGWNNYSDDWLDFWYPSKYKERIAYLNARKA